MTQVFVAIYGGLGNQMFQAAFGIAIERRFGVDVQFLADRTSADIFGRRYMLARFPFIDVRAVSHEAAAGAPAFGEAGVDAETLATIFLEQPKLALHGHWQDERFFFGEERAITAALRFEPSPALARQVEDAGAHASIGVHVRRSEYGHHGLATVEYYLNAIHAIRSEAGSAPVLCFTDEPHFARFAFRTLTEVTIVEPNRDDPVEDFYALSQCRHFVIANSSFSWWAAWLGARDGSIVYAPGPWCVFNPALDPAPQRWRRVENAVRGP